MATMPPAIRIELEGMKQTILHAFTEQRMWEALEMDKAITKALENINVQEIVENTLSQVLHEIVRDAVKHAANQAIWSAFQSNEFKDYLRVAALKGLRDIVKTPPETT